MSLTAQLLTAFVALLHLGFLVLEMFFWTKPLGRKVFRLDPQVARDSAKLAMNQGLYNGFLAAGLAWGLWLGDKGICLFFLGCVVVAGQFGAATVKRSILYVQALPPNLAPVAVPEFWTVGQTIDQGAFGADHDQPDRAAGAECDHGGVVRAVQRDAFGMIRDPRIARRGILQA